MEQAAPYQNPELPIAERVKDLLSRMSLAEKVAQMQCVWVERRTKLLDDDGNFDINRARENYGHGHGLGQVGRPGDSGEWKDARGMADEVNAIQRFFVEESRLGIPLMFHHECLHGLSARNATSFSQPIGLASTFDTDLVYRLYRMVAHESASRGIHQALTPVVDVARDPRWGRVEETFGEDPYLVSRMGVAAVKGFQGDGTFADGRSVIATLKHFAAHGQPESGINCAPVNVSERLLREVFLYPFMKAIQEAGAISVMPSYNEIDGVPSHANRWLLVDVLRNEWGFRGFTVSDYYAIRELHERPDLYGHHLAADGKGAAELAVRAGVNMELPEPDCYRYIEEAVALGSISGKEIDDLVAPILHHKFLMGLFERPYVDPDVAASVAECDAHALLALEAARKTITLLKNEDNLLPLNRSKIRRIAVIGPNAHRELLGGYSGKPSQVPTILEALREYVGDGVEVVYHLGCAITVGGGWWVDEVVLSNPDDDREGIAQAVDLAASADVVVLALGGNEQTSREAWSAEHMGDRTNLQMVGLQDELVDALYQTGKPIAAFLFNGRPLAVSNLSQKAQALFECWYMGQATGRVVAEALFGDINPGGKLPITIPQSVGHIPAYYNHKPSARRGYLFDTVEPLFPFGFGLSYTRFEIGTPLLDRDCVRVGDNVKVYVDVTNVGTRDGDEVVQLYIRDLVSSVTRPVKELKGFQRVSLKPKESRRLTFTITPEHLALWDIGMKYTVEPGEFFVMVGNSCRDEDLNVVRLRVEP